MGSEIMAKRKKRSGQNASANLDVNSFLSPAYWGSFLSFIVGVVGLMVLSIAQGPPQYMLPLPAGFQDHVLAFYSIVGLVCVYIVRYYSAVAAQVYAGSDESLLSLPDARIRTAMFVLLCSLIFLCGVNVMFVMGLGLLPALLICALQSVLSLFTLFGLWVCRRAWPKVFRNVKSGFHWGEVFVFAPVLYIFWSIYSGRSLSGVEIGMIMAIVIIFTLHEWVRFYREPLYDQYKQLVIALQD